MTELPENATARQSRLRAEAATKRADIKTPLGATPPAFPTEELPDLRPAAPKPIIVLATTVAYRGRIVTISNDGMTLDAFCDMLDKRFGVPS